MLQSDWQKVTPTTYTLLILSAVRNTSTVPHLYFTTVHLLVLGSKVSVPVTVRLLIASLQLKKLFVDCVNINHTVILLL